MTYEAPPPPMPSLPSRDAVRRVLGRALRFGRFPLLLLLVTGAIAFAAHAAFTRVPPGKIAVRQLNWGGGLDEEVYRTGLYFGLRGLVSWHFLEQGTHVMEFVNQKGLPGPGPLVIRTKDNNTLQVEATVTYRILPEQASQLVEKGLEFDYDAHARNAVKNVLRKELATLDSEAWIDTERRLARAQEIQTDLNQVFRKFHLECESILIRSVAYPPSFEKELQKKQIQHQKALLFEAQRGLQEEQGEVGAYREETGALVMRERARLDAELATERSRRFLELAELRTSAEALAEDIRAQARSAAREIEGAGQAAVSEGEARGEAARLAALEGLGGRIYLAAEAARSLRIGEIEIDASDARLPSFLDLDAMVGLLAGGPAGNSGGE